MPITTAGTIDIARALRGSGITRVQVRTAFIGGTIMIAAAPCMFIELVTARPLVTTGTGAKPA